MLIKRFVDKINQISPGLKPNYILDIGSRDLDQSLEFMSVFPDTKIIAFEPNPVQFNYCNGRKQGLVEVHELAISQNESDLDFYVPLGNVGAASLLQPIDIPFATNNLVQKIKVKTKRLDSFLEERQFPAGPDIVWMDVQGCEVDAFKSFGKYLADVKFIHCEASELPYYVGHHLKPELLNFFEANGFTAVDFYGSEIHPYREGDLILVNKSLLTQ